MALPAATAPAAQRYWLRPLPAVAVGGWRPRSFSSWTASGGTSPGVGTWHVGPAGPADFLILSVLAGRAGRPSKFVWPAGPISARFRWAGRADCKFSLADFGRPNFLLAGRADVDFFMAEIGRWRPMAADAGQRS